MANIINRIKISKNMQILNFKLQYLRHYLDVSFSVKLDNLRQVLPEAFI